MWWQAPSDTYHSVIQAAQITAAVLVVSLLIGASVTCGMQSAISTNTFWNTRILSHNNNNNTNSAGKFPGDFANFQKISRISRRKNNSSRFPGFAGVLDSLTYHLSFCLFTETMLILHSLYKIFVFPLTPVSHSPGGPTGK